MAKVNIDSPVEVEARKAAALEEIAKALTKFVSGEDQSTKYQSGSERTARMQPQPALCPLCGHWPVEDCIKEDKLTLGTTSLGTTFSSKSVGKEFCTEVLRFSAFINHERRYIALPIRAAYGSSHDIAKQVAYWFFTTGKASNQSDLENIQLKLLRADWPVSSTMTLFREEDLDTAFKELGIGGA